jgi:hypothetical protein
VHLLSVNEAHGKLALALDQVEAMHYVAGIAKGALHEDATTATTGTASP